MLLLPNRHIHLSTQDAKNFGITTKQMVCYLNGRH
ncbi:PduL/EutD family phosphate acyltransferase [Areca yellow leaf disease phytoplasma]